MPWSAYKTILPLLSPMHIGYRRLGNIQRTRPYVPAKNLWAALTTRLTRDDPGPVERDYMCVGKVVEQHLAFTYFFPARDPERPLYPRWCDGEVTYGQCGMRADRFRYEFLGSYSSTALNYAQYAAEEASLHEVEFIAPRTRGNERVYLVGYVFERQDCELPWKNVLNRLRFGGELSYGWGRVGCAVIRKHDGKLFGLYTLDCDDQDRPRLTGQDGPLLAHALAQGSPMLTGHLEPVVGRDWDPHRGAGQCLTEGVPCWTPGSHVPGKARWRVEPRGLWAYDGGDGPPPSPEE
jgi:hypothetical protein